MPYGKSGEAFCEQHSFTGDSNEQWRLEYVWNGYYKIINKSNSLCLTTQNNTTSGKKILLEAYNESSNQLWKFEVIEQGYFKIQSQYHENNDSRLVLAAGVGGTAGTNVEQKRFDSAGDHAHWKLVEVNRAKQDIFFLGVPSSVREEEHDHISCYENGFKYLTNLEYDSINFHYGTINSVADCINRLSNSKVFVSRSHGDYDTTRTWITLDSDNSDRLYSTNLYSNGRANADLSNCDLILYVGCYTAYGGNDLTTSKNLITASVLCGAKCAIGFEDSIDCDPANTWVEEFLRRYVNGESLETAASEAAKKAKNDHYFSDYWDNGTVGVNTYKIALAS